MKFKIPSFDMGTFIIPMSITIVVIIATVIFLTLFLKNKSEKIKMIPVIIMYFIIVALEIWKISFLISERGYFEPSRFPIVFCSMIMYTIPLFAFTDNKFSDVAKTFTVFPSIIAFLLFVVFTGISPNAMTPVHTHSFVYHGLMMVIACYLLSSGLYKIEFRKFYSLFLANAGYISFAMVLSLLLKCDISYFGPGCAQLGIVYKMFGYATGNVILMIAVFILCFVIYGLIHLCSRKKEVK